MTKRSWQQYQLDAEAVFAGLGCSTAIEAVVAGARASHKVDVKVDFLNWGVRQRWLIECKYQKRKIPKSAVETFKSIVLDVGADKGFLLSEVGFQVGAIAAARLTNVSLLSLAELRAGVAADKILYRLFQLEASALRLRKC